VNISIGKLRLNSLSVDTVGEEKQFPPTKIMLQPGKNTIIFDTDKPPVSPQNGDARLLSFKISNFHFQQE
jgi:hypothetical protein